MLLLPEVVICGKVQGSKPASGIVLIRSRTRFLKLKILLLSFNIFLLIALKIEKIKKRVASAIASNLSDYQVIEFNNF